MKAKLCIPSAIKSMLMKMSFVCTANFDSKKYTLDIMYKVWASKILEASKQKVFSKGSRSKQSYVCLLLGFQTPKALGFLLVFSEKLRAKSKDKRYFDPGKIMRLRRL